MTKIFEATVGYLAANDTRDRYEIAVDANGWLAADPPTVTDVRWKAPEAVEQRGDLVTVTVDGALVRLLADSPIVLREAS